LRNVASNEANNPAGAHDIRRRIGSAAILLISLVVAATVCAAFARFFWLGDLAVHFRIQYAALSLLGVIALIWIKRPWLAALAFGTLLVNITTASTALGWQSKAPSQSKGVVTGGPTLKLTSINVFYRNSQHERVVQMLREQRPDVAVLSEVTPQWRKAMEALKDVYAYRYFSASLPIQRIGSRVERGVLMMSRWPIEHAEPIDFGEWAEPGISATLNVHGRPLHVMGVHPCWPLGWDISAERNRELEHIADLAHSTRGPLVVLGDLNITAFSPHFRELLEKSGLTSASHGPNWQPTWPTFLPLAGIQIDHALVSPDVTVVDFRRGPRVGSDHWPIMVEVAPQSLSAGSPGAQPDGIL
jgi:endonuclease/exonuclease/phosphatase (EEP) superfamily protein YafD